MAGLHLRRRRSRYAGAIIRSGLGRVVHALSTEQLIELNPQSGAWPTVTHDGPALFDEAGTPVDDYYWP